MALVTIHVTSMRAIRFRKTLPFFAKHSYLTHSSMISMLSVCYTTSNSRKYCHVGIANQKLIIYLPLVALTAALVTFPALLLGNEHLKKKDDEWKDLLRLLNRFDDTDSDLNRY
jgi:hypothetical protein